jgi:hypothetical protein
LGFFRTDIFGAVKTEFISLEGFREEVVITAGIIHASTLAVRGEVSNGIGARERGGFRRGCIHIVQGAAISVINGLLLLWEQTTATRDGIGGTAAVPDEADLIVGFGFVRICAIEREEVGKTNFVFHRVGDPCVTARRVGGRIIANAGVVLRVSHSS